MQKQLISFAHALNVITSFSWVTILAGDYRYIIYRGTPGIQFGFVVTSHAYKILIFAIINPHVQSYPLVYPSEKDSSEFWRTNFNIFTNMFSIYKDCFSTTNSHERGVGGETGIRTLGRLPFNGFQDRRIRPLCHLSGTDFIITKYALQMFF